MTNKLLLLVSIAPAMLIGCHSSPCADVLIKKDTTVEAERKNTLIAFVGEKISFETYQFNEAEYCESKSKYKILQRVYGCYPGDTIEFTGYTPDDNPEFARYKNVLLYVQKSKGEYRHEYYVYDDVYMTRSGEWAGIYKPEDAADYQKLNIIPKRVEFKDSVIVTREATRHYPHPFYWTVGDRAIAQYGISLEDIFKIKKHGTLTKWEMFGEIAEQEKTVHLEVVEIPIEEAKPEDLEQKKREEKEIELLWKDFHKWMYYYDTTHLKQIIADSLWVCGTLFSKQRLLAGCFRQFFDTIMKSAYYERWYPGYTDIEIHFNDLLPGIRKQIIKGKKGYTLKQFAIEGTDIYGEPNFGLFISFIKTRKGYRLYDIHQLHNRSCCL